MATGRIIKRNGKWAYVISLPFDPEKGRYPQRWRSGFETKKAAQEAMNEDLISMDSGVKSTDLTLKEYGDRYLKSIMGIRAPRTYEVYAFELEQRVFPVIGHKKLTKLTPADIANLYSHLQQSFAPSTVHRVHRTLRALLNRAVKQGYLTKSPLVHVDAPSTKIERRRPLDVEDIEKVMAWLAHRFPVTYLAVYLAVYTGMRRGELCGLRWVDVDFEKSTIRILQTRQRKRGIDIIGDPKTLGSTRPIPVGAEVMDKLNQWKAELHAHVVQREEIWSDESYVLLRQDGTIIDPNTLPGDLRKALRALELPMSSFHDLRHAHATILLRANVPLKVVSERLGHANITLTANTYSHVTETMQREAVEKLTEAFRKPSEK